MQQTAIESIIQNRFATGPFFLPTTKGAGNSPMGQLGDRTWVYPSGLSRTLAAYVWGGLQEPENFTQWMAVFLHKESGGSVTAHT